MNNHIIILKNMAKFHEFLEEFDIEFYDLVDPDNSRQISSADLQISVPFGQVISYWLLRISLDQVAEYLPVNGCCIQRQWYGFN
jgi:hypothetical protein